MRRRFIINIRNNTPNKEIWYTSTDGLVVSPYFTNVFDAVILNNVYDTKNNVGKITFNKIVTTIGDGAFGYCTSLASVTIPGSVTSIGSNAFYSCSSLTSVYCKATTPPALSQSSAFNNNATDRKIYVPYQSLNAYKTASNWSEYAGAIVGYDFENDTIV